MINKRSFLLFWLTGLAIFAVAMILHEPSAIEGMPGGILDHQAAPDAKTVNAIQHAWAGAALVGMGPAKLASFLVSATVLRAALVWERFGKRAQNS